MAKERSLEIRIEADAQRALAELKTVNEYLREFAAEAKKSSKNTESVKKRLDEASASMERFGTVLKGVVAGYASLEGVKRLIDFAEEAAKSEQTAQAFVAAVEAMGENAQEAFAKIKEASRGLIPDAEIMQAATRAMSLGIPLESIAKLMEIAAAKAREMGIDTSKAFDDITTGVARQSPMILDNLGLTIKLSDAYQSYAATIGKSAKELTKFEQQQAIVNAIYETSAQSIERFRDSSLTTNEQMQKLHATVSNLADRIGSALVPVLGDAAKAAEEWVASLETSDIEAAQGAIRGVAKALLGVVKTVSTLNDLAMPDWLGGKDAGLIGTVARGWGMLADRIDFAVSASGRINDAMRQTDALLRAAPDAQRSTVQALYERNRAISDQITKLQQLHDRIAQYSGWSGYRENIRKVDAAIEELIAEQQKNLAVMQELKAAGDPYAKQTEGAAKAAEATAKYSDEAIKSLEADNKRRIADAERTVNALESKERSLAEAIRKINADLVRKLEAIERERVARIESIENKIRQIRREGMGEVARAADLVKQKEEELSRARAALAANDLESYRRHARLYEQLVDEIARKRIDATRGVLTDEETARNQQIAGLKTLEQLENEYYARKKEQARAAAQAALEERKARLEAIKAQLEAQKQLIEASRQLAEALTGKKVSVDTGAIDRAIGKISQIQRRISELNTQKAAVHVDTAPIDRAARKVETLKTLTLNGTTLKVDANTTPADFGIRKLVTKVERDRIVMRVNPEYRKAQAILDAFRRGEGVKPVRVQVAANTAPAKQSLEQVKAATSSQPATLPVQADTSGVAAALEQTRTNLQTAPLQVPTAVDAEALTGQVAEAVQAASEGAIVPVDANTEAAKSAVEVLRGEIVAPEIMPIDGDPSAAEAKIAALVELAQGTVATIVIDADTSAAEAKIAALQRPTYSVHTVYVRTVEQHSTGGPVLQGLAGGGVFTGSGRVPGYDPTDSDSVNARLTGGEFVMPRRVVNSYGLAFMEAIRQERLKLPGYASGGPVGGSTAGHLRPINIHIGGKSFSAFAADRTAKELASYLRRFA